MPTLLFILSSFGGKRTPESTLLLFAIWLGPAVIAALATSWISGREGGGFGRGAAVGIAAALVAGVFGCAVPPVLVAAPIVGAVAAVVTVLRS
jgi:hypothetical protein